MKKILIATAIAAIAVTSQASYLYWQIEASDATDMPEYSGARVFASNDGGVTKEYLTIGYGDYDTGTRVDFADNKVQTPLYDSVVAVVDTKYQTGYSFYIELINYSTGDFVAQSDSSSAMTYTQLQDAEFVGADLSPVRMMNVWHGGSYTTVPEPTSALLMLLGIAGLALKRRVA